MHALMLLKNCHLDSTT